MTQEDSTKEPCAERFIQLARLNLDAYTQRLGMLWKINFALWAAIAVTVAFLLDHPFPHSPYLPCGVAFVIAMIHLWFLCRLSVSNEKDLDWYIYYKEQAEGALGKQEQKDVRGRPEHENGFCYYVWRGNGTASQKGWHRRTKLPLVLGPLLITAILAFGGAWVLVGQEHPVPKGASLRSVTIVETDESGHAHTWSARSEQTTTAPAESE